MRPTILLLPLLVVALLSALARGQSCNTAQNVNSFYNPACTDPLKPYCADTVNGQQCSACHPQKTSQALCDCPANYYCDPSPTSSSFGLCRRFDITTQPCAVGANCKTAAAYMNSYDTWSCVSNLCRMCNVSYFGNGTSTCGGGWPYPLSSRPGETRTCGNDGNWISGGQINVVNQSATTAPPSPSGSGSSSSSGNKSESSLFLVTLALAGVAALALGSSLAA